MDSKILLNLLRNPWGEDLQKLRKNRRAAAEYIEALESSHAELLRVCELAVEKWFSGETSEYNMELELRSAIHWAKKATGEK